MLEQSIEKSNTARAEGNNSLTLMNKALRVALGTVLLTTLVNVKSIQANGGGPTESENNTKIVTPIETYQQCGDFSKLNTDEFESQRLFSVTKGLDVEGNEIYETEDLGLQPGFCFPEPALISVTEVYPQCGDYNKLGTPEFDPTRFIWVMKGIDKHGKETVVAGDLGWMPGRCGIPELPPVKCGPGMKEITVSGKGNWADPDIEWTKKECIYDLP